MKTILVTLFMLLASAPTISAVDDPYRVDTFPVRSGGTLTVQTSGGSITVAGTNKSEARVEMTVRRNGNVLRIGDTDLSDWKITIRKDGNDVIAMAEKKRSGSGNIWTGYNNLSISFTVYVPSTYSTNLSTSGGRIRVSNLSGMHQVRTSGGSLDFDNLSGEISGQTSGGSINASEINGVFDVATSGGSIRVDDIEGMVTLKTSGGSIRIENARGSFDASTSGGSINADFMEVTGPIDLATSGGSVTVSLPRGLGFNLDARGNRVVADDVAFNGRTERDRMTGTVNGGGVPVRLRTSAGTVRITTE
jgi:DUF4097 and DUF4098 domain-containing protein YvlB